MIPFSHLFEMNKQYTRAQIDETIVADCLKRFKEVDGEDPLTEPEFHVLLGILYSERSSQKVDSLLGELQVYLMKKEGVKLQ